MVFFFTSNVVDPPYTIYMGRDKYENNELLKYCWPEDVWFHVSKLSSAHVYLRLHKGQTVDDIPAEALQDCCQLVKANSIEGCKLNKVDIVYTPVGNLRQTNDMDVGQVGFHVDKHVKQYVVDKKQNEIVNRLNKTKTEIPTEEFISQREQRDNQERDEKKRLMREQKQRDKEEEKRRQESAELKNYSSLMSTDKMRSNKDGNESDEFMSVLFEYDNESYSIDIICQTCVDKHQVKLHETLKEQWNLCKTKFEDLCQIADTYDKDAINYENEIDQIRTVIDQRRSDLIHLVENEKNNLLSKIDEYIQSNFANVQHIDLQQLYDSINQRLIDVFQNPSASFSTDDFLMEINYFNMLISNREKQIQTFSLKYPYLSPPKSLSISDVFGELQWTSKAMSNSMLTKPSVATSRLMHEHILGEAKGGSQEHSTTIPDDSISLSSTSSLSLPVMQRQKQWTTDAAGVPHFLCILSKKNHLLFACDKFGSIDLYQLDSTNSKNAPRHLRHFELFPGNTTNKQPQIIETFTVYTPFIVVAAHLSDQTDTSSIYFFDHRGCQQGETCLQNFPVRQLSADVGFRCLWGVDRHQHLVYYNQLPINVQQIGDFMKQREEFLKFGREFEPIRIAQNQTSVAIVERNSQSAHIFDKQTKKQINEVENLLRTKGIFRLWNALIRDDNSMVLKLDEDLPPNSRPPSINHLILELDPTGASISQIERTSVFGFVIGPNDEILLGCKRYQQNGLIECYI
ncbi:unnamed protein product [Adineta ricciae]|uniref:Coiled-coil domain-containing protein 25 n=1 Tax=Adineta ricciae TaxID=249248 RepID=A0A814ZWY1_ADIRI|nr:unnamed protein product [Adineta ricciae]